MQIREMDDQVDRYMFSLNSYLWLVMLYISIIKI